MSSVDRIQAAEASVAQLQDTLDNVQVGLERAEAVAVAAEEAKRRSEQTLRVAFGLLGLTIVLLVLSQRRRRS